MKPISLFGTGIQSLSSYVTAQRRLNCIYEIREDGDKSKIIIRSAAGLEVATSLGSSPIRGWVQVEEVLYAVAGNTFYSMNSALVITTIGTLTTNQGIVGIVDNGVQIYIADGTNGYIYTLETGPYGNALVAGVYNGGAGTVTAGSWGKIGDANYTSTLNSTQFVTYMHGRFVAARFNTQQFWLSASYDGTLWTPINFASKEDHSDDIHNVDVIHDIFIAWGDQSIEFWQDVGAYPFPWTRVPGTTQDYGLAADYSAIPFNNTYAFLAQNSQGQVQVMMLNGFIPVRISTHDIEDTINEFIVKADAIGLSYMDSGHSIYQLTFPGAGRTFVYDGTTNMWAEGQSNIGLSGRHLGNLSISFNSQNCMSDYSNGNIYYVNDDVYTHNGQAVPRILQSRHIHADGDKLTIGSVQLDMAVGVGLQVGQGSDPQMMLEVSKDGGKTYGSPRLATIGTVGKYTTRVIWNRIGEGFDFVFRFTVTDPVQFIILGGRAVLAKHTPS